MELTKKQSQQVLNLCNNDPTALAICAAFLTRTRSWPYHTAERLLQYATAQVPEGDELPTYAEVLEVIKKFQDFGLGTYKQGRKGKKTRIEWAEGISIIAVGEAAENAIKGNKYARRLESTLDKIDLEPDDAVAVQAVPKDMVRHPYKLRPDLELPVFVPKDLTPVEARRLAAFVGSLSME